MYNFWTKLEDEILIEMTKEDKKARKIAVAVNRTRAAVYDRARYIDIWGDGKPKKKERPVKNERYA